MAAIAGVALFAAGVAAPVRAFEVPQLKAPKLETPGPLDSTIRAEVFNRLRGEFVDWFDPKQGNSQPIHRYNFLGNKFQLGLRVKRDPIEMFAQVQHSLVATLPGAAQGPGGLYFANTHDTFQEQAFLRQGWARLKGPSSLSGLSLTGGSFLYRDGIATVSRSYPGIRRSPGSRSRASPSG